MALNDISFVKGQGGLGRPLAGQDHYSGLVFYSSTLPSGLSTSNRIKKMLSPADADAIGLKMDYSDETKASATYTVTAAGSNGDTITLNVTEPSYGAVAAKVIALGTYTKVSADTTATSVATGIAAAINAGTSVHGYSAAAAAAVVTITARKGLGISLNSGTPLAAAITGTIAGTLVQFTGGVASKFAVLRYHINEFFRLQPLGVLYVGIFAVPGGAYTFTEITTLQNFSGGVIRQVGVYKDTAAFAVGDLTTIDGVCKANDASHKNISALYAGDMSAVVDLTTLTDLNTLSANKASAVIAQDGANVGAQLYSAYGKSITTLGAALGAVAAAKVNESIAWVQKFNISDGQECDTLAFANGLQYSSATVTDSFLANLHNQRYIFLRKFSGFAGSYFNDNHCACSVASDYAYISDNRTIDKAIRGVYVGLIPDLNAPLQLNSDGTLSDVTIASLTSDARTQLDQMVRDRELSAYGITIDTTQNVLSTSKVVIAIKDIPMGVARNIEVDIMNAKSL